MWVAYAFGSAFFAGVTSILAKAGIRNVDSHLATAIRTVVVAIFAWLMVFVTGSQDTIGQISDHSLLFLGLSGLATGASWLCYYRALQLGDVNKVTPVDKSSTLLTMLLGMLLLGESVTVLKVACMALIALGTWLMIERRDALADDRPEGGSWLFYAALSAVFASLTAILGKIGIQDVESNLGTAMRTMVVLVMAWCMVFITGKQGGISRIDRGSWCFLGLSGVATGLSWLCYYRALQEGPASVVVPIDKLSILVTVGFASLVLKEKLSGRAAIGLAAMVAGILLLLI